MMTCLLVAGSYPPIPGVPAAATIAAVRRGWQDGYEVEVVSPRPSAAHHTAHLVGFEAGPVLERVRAFCAADELVLCMEPGMPFSRKSTAARHSLEARLLARGLRRFRRVSVVVTGDLGVAASSLGPFWRHVQEVVVSSEAEGSAQAARYGFPPGLIRVDRRGYVEPSSARASSEHPLVNSSERVPTPPAVTVLGPNDWAWYDWPRRRVNRLARKLLGRHADSVRGYLFRVADLRRLVGRVRRAFARSPLIRRSRDAIKSWTRRP
jgi:hypothetical protein